MSWSIQADEMLNSAEVYGSDGDKVGKVAAVFPAYIVVEKGFLFPTDYYIPRGAIGSVDNDRIYLTATKDTALRSGWNVPPIDLETATPGTTPGNLSDSDEIAIQRTEQVTDTVRRDEVFIDEEGAANATPVGEGIGEASSVP